MIQLTMMKFLCSICERIGNRCVRLGKFFYMDTMEKRVIPWVHVKGDQTLRLDYSLSSDSVVFDVGGYEGKWTSDIFSKFCCHVHVFEPVPEFAENIKKRFEKNHRIVIHPFGLSDRTTMAEILLDNDGSSICKKNSGGKNIPTQSIKLMNIKDFIAEQEIRRIDLMKINIEGGEYDLLDFMISSNLIAYVGNLQVQFHDFVPEASVRMEKIRNFLSLTHTKTWSYEFVWENWVLK